VTSLRTTDGTGHGRCERVRDQAITARRIVDAVVDVHAFLDAGERVGQVNLAGRA
jgi:hypothetical protein